MHGSVQPRALGRWGEGEVALEALGDGAAPRRERRGRDGPGHRVWRELHARHAAQVAQASTRGARRRRRIGAVEERPRRAPAAPRPAPDQPAVAEQAAIVVHQVHYTLPTAFAAAAMDPRARRFEGWTERSFRRVLRLPRYPCARRGSVELALASVLPPLAKTQRGAVRFFAVCSPPRPVKHSRHPNGSSPHAPRRRGSLQPPPAHATNTMPRDPLVDVAVDRDTGRRTLVAKRRFEAGETLATDTPLIVWSQNEAGLLKAFQSSDQQDAILALYSPALDRQDEKIDDRRKKAASLARTKAFSTLDKDVILKVLLIGDAFAHQFRKQSALYETASAMRHDCAPNCRFRSTPDGSIEVTSIRHIPAGETLSFSYIGVPWVLCTSERRKLLRESFEFFCVCRRCQAPDVLRSAPCPGCGNFCALEEPIAPPQGPSSIFWHCPVCAKPFDATLHEEQLSLDFKNLSEKVQKASSQIRDAYARGKAPPQKVWDVFKDCEDFNWRAAKELGRGNVIVYRATELVVNTARDFSVAKDSFSAQNISTDGDSAEDLRRRWVEATIRRVAQQECAAAGCSKGGECFATESEHPAVYEAAETVCGCAPVLETQLSSLEREAFFDLCAKYRPQIRLMYDATDEEKARVELLESLLNAAPVEEEGAEEGVEEEKGA